MSTYYLWLSCGYYNQGWKKIETLEWEGDPKDVSYALELEITEAIEEWVAARWDPVNNHWIDGEFRIVLKGMKYTSVETLTWLVEVENDPTFSGEIDV